MIQNSAKGRESRHIGFGVTAFSTKLALNIHDYDTMKPDVLCIISFFVLLMTSCSGGKTEDERMIDDLMSSMTLEEKLGQLNCLVAPRGAVTGEQQSTGVMEKVKAGSLGSLFGRHDREELMAWQKMAVGENGKAGILVTYFTNDKNVVGDKVVELEVKDYDIKESVSHVVDAHHLYTEVPVEFVDGKTTLWLSPNSVTYIELN